MTPLQALSVDDIFNQAHLRRWHQIKMNREQTLAEHQYLVAMLASKIILECGGPQSQVNAAVTYALLHDAHEPEMVGDIASNPLPRLRANEGAGYDVGDAMQEDYWKARIGGGLEQSVEPAVHLMVKLCDKLEALIHYILNGDPRTYPHRRIPEGLLESVLKAHVKITQEHCAALGISCHELREWMQQELRRWVDRTGVAFGPMTCSNMYNQLHLYL